MSQFGRGLKPPTPGKSAHRMGAASHPLIGAALRGSLAGSADLSPQICPRMDQRQTETCFAHSAAALLGLQMAIAGKPLGWVPSPELIAQTTYADVRAAAHPSGDLPVLQDTGAELQDVATAMARWGVGPMGPIVDNSNSDVPDPTGYGFPEADPNRLVVAGSHLIGGEYSIDVDANAPAVVAAALDAKISIWCGGLVGAAYQAATENPTLVQQPTPASDTTGGGHAQGIVGYRTNADGALEFKVCNSWGASWGSNGLIWVSSAWVAACWMLWPFAVQA
jgi:hypothetical protein